VCHALRTALQPEALLFDLDGVLADVSRSYRETTIRTARDFGVEASGEDVRNLKRSGGFNNDWDLTHRLISDAGMDCSWEGVRDVFERTYQGDERTEGLKVSERLLVSREFLTGLRERLPLAIVTGRPRPDACEFLRRFAIEDCFDTVVTMEDAPAKPEPDAVELAMHRLRCERAWMIGDTVDDVRAARAAGVVPIGICAPGDDDSVSTDVLICAGASRVLGRLDAIEEMLP
jgi:HAD superfamily hydrolase (TIGR01548 family)